MFHKAGVLQLAEDNNLKDEAMRRFGQRMTKGCCLMLMGVFWGLLTVVAGERGAWAADADRVLLLGVSEGAQRNAAVTEALLKQLKGTPAAVVQGPDVNLLECQDPSCWKQYAEQENATVVIKATLTRSNEKSQLRTMSVQLYDVASAVMLEKPPREVAAKDLSVQLAEQIRQMLRQNEEERAQRPVATQTPVTPSPVVPVRPGPVAPALPDEPPSWWQRTSTGRKLAIGGLTVGAIGLLAGGAVLYTRDGQGTMGPCTSGSDSQYRNCVTDYRGGYITMFVAAPVMLGVAIYLAVKK